jgi:alpha-1,6-mannosyltransferase
VVAVCSPATLPWYFSWALVAAAALAWSKRGLMVATFGSVWIVLVTFPDGTTGLYDWPYLATAMLLSCFAAVSLVRFDPPWPDPRASTPATTANRMPTPASPAPTTFGDA